MSREYFQSTRLNRSIGQLTGNQIQKLQTHLARSGVSALGARQFASGGIVTDPQDRRMLAGLLYSSSAVGYHEITGALVKIN